MRLLNRYDEQIRQDALSLTEKAFCNIYRHYDIEENLKRIQKDIQNEPSREKRKEIVNKTDEAVDFPELPPMDKDKEKESLKDIIAHTDEGQYESFILPIIPGSTFGSIKKDSHTPTRSVRMKELISEGLSKADIKKQMEDEGFEFKGSVFHSEYNRLNK